MLRCGAHGVAQGWLRSDARQPGGGGGSAARALGDAIRGGPASPGGRSGGARLRLPDRVPARPGSDRAFPGLPPPAAEDAGLPAGSERPLPQPAHPYAGGRRPGAHAGAGPGAQRGPDRGDRPRARPRPVPVRDLRRGGPARHPDRPRADPGTVPGGGGGERRLSSQRSEPAGGRPAREAVSARRAQPDRPGARGDPAPGAPVPDVRYPDVCDSGLNLDRPPSLECQVVALADRVAQQVHDLDDGLQEGEVELGEVERLGVAREVIARAGGALASSRWVRWASSTAASCTCSWSPPPRTRRRPSTTGLAGRRGEHAGGVRGPARDAARPISSACHRRRRPSTTSSPPSWPAASSIHGS